MSRLLRYKPIFFWLRTAIGAGRNNQVGRNGYAPFPKGAVARNIGVALPVKGLGKYCELCDRGLRRNPATNVFCALPLLF